ncbi:acyltransferase 3 [Sphingopyxis fribergensis]|uniref:Acyltransferase 3 n=1 Tax=Sphingopyxis fribergensis TaxID=1515612 RepID=A0A0A7PG62_9SPHN|nr:acyltransferase family protein [Sphingopyxis fribergensis]AJA09000.1 acyltransferase 3 [Sphingopyxis fribergensis]
MERPPLPAYRYDIDGLRALAVASVVIFHLFHNVLPGGYLGVDIFFVISGFLISGIIMRDIEKSRFSISVFYQRRIRRLMPALTIVLIVTSIAGAIILLPADLEGYGKSLIAAIFFVANIYFWRDTDYFSRAAENKPLLHLWSLGIEEQFYIFFPLILFFLARHRSFLLPAIWALTIGSLALNIALLKIGGGIPAFYLLPTRAWELGAGALIALHGPAMLAARTTSGVRVGAFLLMAAGLLYGGEWPSWFPVAIPAVLGAALLIWVGAPQQSATGRLLGLPPVNLTGRISYSLYLWHWPLIVLLKYYLVRDLGLIEGCAVGAAAFAAAFLSYKYVESPFRASTMPFRKVGLYALAGTLLLLAAAALFTVTRGLPDRLDANAASINRSVDTHYRCPVSKLMSFGASRACDLSLDGKDSAAAEVALIGNSHAQMYAPIVERQLRKTGQAGLLIPINSCLPTVSVNVTRECFGAAQANLDALKALPHVKTVIVAFNWPVDKAVVSADGRRVGGDRALAMAHGVEDLAAKLPGRKIIVVGPIAQPGFDIASVLSRQIAFGINPQVASRTAAKPFRAQFAPALSVLAANPRITVIRPDLRQCDAEHCYFVRGGLSLFSDSNHIAAPALPVFEPEFVAALAKEGATK